MPQFDKSISLGNVLTIIAIIGGLMTFGMQFENRITVIEEAQAATLYREAQFQAYVKEKLSEIREDVRELRKGK